MSGPKALGTVPNSSEPFGTVPIGRTPMKSDAELLEVAKRLTDKLGRLPRTQELVDQAGGCQRQRAIRTIQLLRTQMAEKSVRSQLVIPPFLQDELQTIFARWLDCAASQLAEKQAEAEAKLEEKLTAANDAVLEKADRIVFLQARLKDLEHLQQELFAGGDQQKREISQLRSERDRATALAEERQRVLDTLLRNLPQTASAVSEAD